MTVTVTVTGGTRTIKFRANSVAQLLPQVRTAFGEGLVIDSDDVALSEWYGDLAEGCYTWIPSKAGPGSASTTAGAAASQLLAAVSRLNVMRLVDAGETVGSCCLVSFNDQKFVLTARHCMKPLAGQHIDVTSFTVCGHRLRHLASFPKYDVTVLLLHDGAELSDVLRNAIPFEVDGGTGLMPGVKVTLFAFPQAADQTIMGFQQSDIPLVAEGIVSWLSKEADEAIGSYTGGFPNCSGSTVAFGPPFRYLAGIHTCTMRHEHGTRPRDTATAADQDDDSDSDSDSSSGAPAAVTAAGGELVVETDVWSAATGPTGQASACGGNKKWRPSSQQEGVPTFVPAHVLVRLLGRCHGLLAAACDKDRGR